jgi:hypothetical protein
VHKCALFWRPKANHLTTRPGSFGASLERGDAEWGYASSRMGGDRTERDQPHDQRDKPATGRRRVNVPEAADLLGLTVEAIRGRIKRGTIDHERDGERVFVLVDTDHPPTSHGQSGDKPSDQPHERHPDESARELVEEMRDRIDDLRRRLDQSEEARRRADTIIMQLTQTNAALAARVPELEAVPQQEPPGAPESAAAEAEGAQAPPAAPSPRTDVQRPWWRRILGG